MESLWWNAQLSVANYKEEGEEEVGAEEELSKKGNNSAKICCYKN